MTDKIEDQFRFEVHTDGTEEWFLIRNEEILIQKTPETYHMWDLSGPDLLGVYTSLYAAMMDTVDY